jgi:hypothetical protein
MTVLEEIKSNLHEITRMIQNETSEYYSKLSRLAEDMESDIDYHADKILENLREIETGNEDKISINKPKEEIKQRLQSMKLISSTDRGVEIAFMTLLGYSMGSITQKDIEKEKSRNNKLFRFVKKVIKQIKSEEVNSKPKE